METFIRKGLRLKAHSVVKVEEDEAGQELVIRLDRREHRRLHCGECGRAALRIAPMRRPERRWRDLAVREHVIVLVYAPCRVRCPRCGLRVERVPWADKWQRVTHALARAVATLARELTWSASGPPFPPELEDDRCRSRRCGALGAAASPLGAAARHRHR